MIPPRPETSIVVVGSANVDVTIALNDRPGPGETVLGTDTFTTVGGKGLNQAIAAARRMEDYRVGFVGRVGDDDDGRSVIDALDAHSIGTDHVARGVQEVTGRAYIMLTPDGENSIIVLPNANAHVAAIAVVTALDSLRPSVVLTQLEIGDSAVDAAALWCSRNGARFILNLSPGRPLDPNILRLADPLIVNKGEAEVLLGLANDDVAALATALAGRARSVVVTAGAEGAYIAEGEALQRVHAERVRIVDTTGAGDCFAGTLAAVLAVGGTLVQAAAEANATAGQVVELDRRHR